MKRISIVPWSSEYMDDQLFNLDNKILNRDDGLYCWLEFKQYLNDNSFDVHTIDKYKDLKSVDLFIFFTFDKDWYQTILKQNLEDRTIYIAFEPPVVDKNHSYLGLKKLLGYFHYLLTWNDDFVDNKRIFKFMYPYYFYHINNNTPFNMKKLLINVSGNKQSAHPDELYSERRKVIQYFDDNGEFALYGTGWENENYKSYKGMVEAKKTVYGDFKFALCLENMKNVKGYVTEKILDCLCNNIVPIYMGASNIEEYIPKECYILYNKFTSISEMQYALEHMSEKQYNEYIYNINLYLNSKKQMFLAVGRCLV